MATRRRAPADLFWEKVDKSGDCWLWTAKIAKNRGGYGCFSVTLQRDGVVTGEKTPQKTMRAHVFAWELTHGHPVPEGQVVMHTCDNPPCVRPDHLVAGTQLDNRQDCKAKGRTARGSEHAMAKLTEEQVIEIRTRRAGGEKLKSIAAAFAVAQCTVSEICKRRTWGHLGTP